MIWPAGMGATDSSLLLVCSHRAFQCHEELSQHCVSAASLRNIDIEARHYGFLDALESDLDRLACAILNLFEAYRPSHLIPPK